MIHLRYYVYISQYTHQSLRIRVAANYPPCYAMLRMICAGGHSSRAPVVWSRAGGASDLCSQRGAWLSTEEHIIRTAILLL